MCGVQVTGEKPVSVSEVLDMCMEDAEQVLFNLGFGQEEPQFTSRIPPRFFDFPSKLKGINFRLFLESQLCRLKEEDPSLSIASRFHQVEVLTATANAFYSLYSYVSKTPIQKLAPPEFSFSSPTEKISQRFSVRSEPRSPVERFKDTISKMCLYTKEPGSPAASPRSTPQKRHSLPSLIESVHDSTKNEKQKTQDFRNFYKFTKVILFPLAAPVRGCHSGSSFIISSCPVNLALSHPSPACPLSPHP
uniref:ITPR-interacting domain-containing protein n=1 Tax=Erpetoichthys calabaricus TaxID=27687 RepID=A0A8C4RVD7_ERPCA